MKDKLFELLTVVVTLLWIVLLIKIYDRFDELEAAINSSTTTTNSTQREQE